MRRTSNQTGFTLTEVLASIAILGILMTCLGILFTSTNNAQRSLKIKQNIVEQELSLMDEMMVSTNSAATANKVAFCTYLHSTSIDGSQGVYHLYFTTDFSKSQTDASANYLEYTYLTESTSFNQTKFTFKIDVFLEGKKADSYSTTRIFQKVVEGRGA